MSEEINELRPVHLECFQEIHRLNDRIKLLELRAHATARAQEKGIKRLHSGKRKLIDENDKLKMSLESVRRDLRLNHVTFADLVRIFGQIKNPSELKSEDL